MQIVEVDIGGQSWLELSTIEQLAHVGRIVGQAIYHRHLNNQSLCNESIARVLGLLDSTITDPKNVKRLSEINAVKMAFIDDFQGKNEYKSTDQAWHKYFSFFQHLVKIEQGKMYDTDK